MNPTDKQIFNENVALAEAGHKSDAYAKFARLRQTYPDDVDVLLWFAYTAPELNQAREALGRAIQLQPTNPTIIGAQSWLAQEEKAQLQVANSPVNLAVSESGTTRAVARTIDKPWPPLPQMDGLISMEQVPDVAVRSTSSKKWYQNIGCVASLVAATAALVGLIAIFAFSSNGTFANGEGQAALENFFKATSQGNTDGAYKLVLPEITQQDLKTQFLDPSDRQLKDYANLVINSNQYYSYNGGSSLAISGIVTYKTLGTSTLQAQLTKGDNDDQWYIVSLQLGPPTKSA